MQVLCRGVLGHEHVSIPLPFSPFVVHGAVHAVLLFLLHPEVGLVEVIAIACLVAQRPEGYAGVVLVSFVDVLRAVEVWFEPFGVVAQGATFTQVVVHAVALDVGFVIDVDAVFVAELIEAAVLRVVAEAHGVDVVLLHQREVEAHLLLGHVVARVLVVLVDIHAFQLQWLSVDVEQGELSAAGGTQFALLDFDAAEAYVVGDDLSHLSVLGYRHQQMVECGRF